MWSEQERVDFYNKRIGQISTDTESGKLLMHCIRENAAALHTVLEIGTWNGLGSTTCILQALQGRQTRFISLEINREKQVRAQANLVGLLQPNTELLWGSVLRSEDIVDVEALFPELDTDTVLREWLSIDMANLAQAPYVYDQLPTEIDFILFDGGEFTTFFEFEKLFPHCNRFIALDDIHTSKCRSIYEFLKGNPLWKGVGYTEERNGFAIFQRISMDSFSP